MGQKRHIIALHRRRMRSDVKSRIAELRRQAAEQEAAVPQRTAIAVSEAPEPTQNALLLKMTRDELRAEAKSQNLTGYGHLNKQGLRDLLGVEG